MSNRFICLPDIAPVFLRIVAAALLFLALEVCAEAYRPAVEPAHPRPYLLSAKERARILGEVAQFDWAEKEYQAWERKAKAGSGYEAALLYALTGESGYLQIAKSWLTTEAKRGGDLGKRALTADDQFFLGGQPWLGDVYYGLNTKVLEVFDLLYNGLSEAERKTIRKGLLASARFRQRAMDRWTQTANLVFKPTFMVAAAALLTDDPELKEWGFYRKPGSNLGGYFSVLNDMLHPSGPWKEAPLYPIAHKSLQVMQQMSAMLQQTTGKEWFKETARNGGSPAALLQYFIDTTYPAEELGNGKRRFRIATIGDGATDSKGDLFLVSSIAGLPHAANEELADAYGLTRNPDYEAFLSEWAGYRPQLRGRPPLPETTHFPAAPSTLREDFGLAMLRSDETPGYWRNPDAIAVSARMSQGYGHGHADQFGITLFGAGRLLYPDFNAVQYENPALGWTSDTVAHNTVVVDESRSSNAEPLAIRHRFDGSVKFFTTSATDAYPGVEQTRALVLTADYLLDLFQLDSLAPRTYDYAIHSFGRPQPQQPRRFKPSSLFEQRYHRVPEILAASGDSAWQLDMVIDEAVNRTRLEKVIDGVAGNKPKRAEGLRKEFGEEWLKHRAAVRINLAAAPATTVGVGTDIYGLGTLIARRIARNTLFAATHEPYAGKAKPQVTAVEVVVGSNDATVLRVTGAGFVDYAAVALGSDAAGRTINLGAKEERFSFRDYAYARFTKDGLIAQSGEWLSYHIAKSKTTSSDKGYWSMGKPTDPPQPDEPLPDSPFALTLQPEVVQLRPENARTVQISLADPQGKGGEAWLEFFETGLVVVTPSRSEAISIPPGGSGMAEFTFTDDGAGSGFHQAPFKVWFRADAKEEFVASGGYVVPVAVGNVLRGQYRFPKPAVYQIHAGRYQADAQMWAGLITRLVDDDGKVFLDGTPLFTFADEQIPLLTEETENAYTWPNTMPVRVQAHVENHARWSADYLHDRIVVKMDPVWTQAEQIQFTIPGDWSPDRGRASWAVVLDTKGDPVLRDGKRDIRGAELAFAGAEWNLCFGFLPGQRVVFSKTGLKFSIGGMNGDSWAVGVCRPDTLRDWLQPLG